MAEQLVERSPFPLRETLPWALVQILGSGKGKPEASLNRPWDQNFARITVCPQPHLLTPLSLYPWL